MSKRIRLIQGHPDLSLRRLCHTLEEAYMTGSMAEGHETRRIDVAALDEAGVRQAQMLGAESALLRPLKRETVRSKVNRMHSQSVMPNRMPALSRA